jgi:hypothetical protein
MTTHPRPENGVVTIAVELSPSLGTLANPDTPLNAALCSAIEGGLATLMTTLGIPGPTRVSVAGYAGGSAGPLLRIAVNGARARYPDELLLHAYGYVHARLLDIAVTPSTIAEWIREQSEHVAESDGQRRVVEYLGLVCVEIVKRQPQLLFALPQAVPYAASLSPPPDPQWLLAVLRPVLELRLSLANRSVVAEALALGQQAPRAPEDVVEDLVDALRPDTLDIHASREWLQALTLRWEGERELFPFLRDGIFVELGLPFPRLRLVASDRLKPQCFAFSVNHCASLPLRGLGVDEHLVNDTAERLRATGLHAEPARSPVTGQPNSVVGTEAEPRAKALGITTWNQMGHLVLCLAEHLRQHGWCLVHRGGLQPQLRTLERVAPALLAAVRARHSERDLTRLLRALVRDRVSIRNLRDVLEHLLDHDLGRETRTTTSSKLDPAVASAEARVRHGLGREIAYKAARGTNTLVVYLLDSELVRVVTDAARAAEDEDRVLHAVRTELAQLPPTAQIPNLLTGAESRVALQRLIASEFPRMTVVAHEDLPPGTNVQPVARIQLDPRS